MGVEGGIERRQFARYTVNDNVFLTFRPNFDRIGRIKDVSEGGTAFEYVTYDTYSNTRHVEVDIFSQIEGFHCPKIPCEVMYDVKLENYPSFDGIETRRCGLKFGNLSEQQLVQLNFLISNFGQSIVPVF